MTMNPQRYLQVSIRRIEDLQRRLKQASKRITQLRIACFFLTLFLCAALLEWGTGTLSFIGAVTGCFIFGIFVRQHQQIRLQQRHCTRSIDLKKAHLARIALDWSGVPEIPLEPALPDHPFEIDLDVTGSHSLFRLLHTCFTQEGGARLKQWLLRGNANLETLKKRQQQVARLAPFVAWRDRLHLNLSEAASAYRQPTKKRTDAEQGWQSNLALERLNNSGSHKPGIPLIVLTAMAIFTALFYTLNAQGLLGSAYWQVSLAIYVLTYWVQRHNVGQLFTESQGLQFEFHQLAALFDQLEQFTPGKDLVLSALFSPFQSEDPPSQKLRQLGRIVAAASLQGNPLLWGGINLIVPWDMFFAWRYEKLKPRLKLQLPRCMESLWELEALCALAHYSWGHPALPFPEFQKEGLEGNAIGHPLLPPQNKVRNNFFIKAAGDGFLITGSNMAGKSTFLKSLGLNIVLAEAGSVVDADIFKLSRLRLMTCIRVSDSVSDGFSYFYAEVRRLKAILDAIKTEQAGAAPVFYLVDEIFKGTNNRERLLGSQAYLKALAGEKAMGGVSTHDLELVNLADEHPRWENYHFREFIEDKKMVFDYTLRSGPCPTTNALHIMALEGLPVPANVDQA